MRALQDTNPDASLVAEVSTAGNDEATWLSADNYRLDPDLSGTFDLYVATREP